MDDFNKDMQLLVQDKYDGDSSRVTDEDKARLSRGEPLAYVIGWVPFLGLKIWLDSHPLIPRPETEWWTELLITHLRERFGTRSFTLLDLCAGSGAIGLAILKSFPNARVYFGELIPAHCELIRKNIESNGLDNSRASVRESHLFESFTKYDLFDCIATNPPYIPESRELDESVTRFEPEEALLAGVDGLSIISQITKVSPSYLAPGGEIWMECDIENAEATQKLLTTAGAIQNELRTDLYGRPRLVVAYF